jgi:O-acetylhomoserine (thiol)-lyase
VTGNIYSRIMNPTNDVFEQRKAAMEAGGGWPWHRGWPPSPMPFTITESGDNIVSTSTL